MASIARGQESSWSEPALVAYVMNGGFLVDPVLLEYAIFERVTEDYGTQVYPEEVGTRALVDLQPLPVGDQIGPGTYVARWQVPMEAQIGRHEIRFWFRFEADDPLIEWSYAWPFEVVTYKRTRGPEYAMVQDMRDEGISPERVDDPSMHAKIVLASRLFEQFTGRTFEPRYKTLQVNGRGNAVLTFEEPIIAIAGIGAVGDRYYVDSTYARDLSEMRVYNRHLRGLSDPDDREHPRVEFANAAYGVSSYAIGRQNIAVTGLFGYTDFDPQGPPTGVTPDLVRHAVKLLAFKELPLLTNIAARDEAQKRWRITGESTREQSYHMFGGVDAAQRGAVVGGTTGDPEIDNIIHLYRRGSRFGAA